MCLREAPPKLSLGSKGHCPNREGGLNACQDGLGHLSAPNQMGNLLDCVGVKMLARMVWGTYNHQHGDLTKLLNSVRK